MSDNSENSVYTSQNTGYTPSDKPHTGSLDQKINQLHAERRQEYGNNRPTDPDKPKNRKVLYVILAVIVVLLAALGAWLLFGGAGTDNKTPDQPAESPELRQTQLELAQSEFENLDREFSEFETQRQAIVNDTLMNKLEQKYQAASLQVEQLKKELKDAANKSSAEIKKLKDQIQLLRELIKGYLRQIDELTQENAQLRADKQELTQHVEQLSTNLAQTQREREHLAERMTLAEKLNVTGLTMTMLKNNGKQEKKIKNARKFLITFTIPQNNSTPVGVKDIYAVITTPEGQLLDGAGTFAFEGGNVSAAARKQIDYGGQEIGGIEMYYDIRNALTPGEYTVQLFCDGYALCDPRSFTYK